MIAVHHGVSSSSSLVHNEEDKNTIIPPSDVYESDIPLMSTMVFISIIYMYTLYEINQILSCQ